MAKSANLASLLTLDTLRHLADARSFVRGDAYFSEGRVRSLLEEGGILTANVSGTREYRVRLEVEEGELGYSCTCPVGDEGDFCKHCVAVGLAWLASEQGTEKKSSGKKDKAVVSPQDVRAYLAGLDKTELVEMVMAQTREDDRLYKSLLLRAAKTRKKGVDLDIWRQAIDDAVYVNDFVNYREASDYAQGIDEVIDSIEELLQGGHAAGVIDLTEYALAEVEKAIEQVDDSDGSVGGLLERLQNIHLAACQQAKPEPVPLAERLFAWEIRSGFGVFGGAAKTYAGLLGKTGLDTYRRLLETAWAKLPVLAPGQERDRSGGNRFQLTSMMETIARQSGDEEQLVAVLRRDLASPYQFLKIAETYQQAGKTDRALEWAERGWNHFSGGRHDARLRAFLADAYHGYERHDEAMALVWEGFIALPRLEGYQDLKKHADRAHQWKEWREKALALVRERMAASGKTAKSWTVQTCADRSLLVEIFLWEGDGEQAWWEAKEGGCAPRLWLQLASAREKSHPEDSLAIYKAQVASTMEHTGDQAYQTAVTHLRNIKKLLTVVGRPEEFSQYVTTLRQELKRKRNFIKLLDKEGW
ncbi:MAG: SWIM zinc finger family protein [Magnetococcales bacterium]|nr:SWIM zinc finger family protein [Magnetococcales bacterium]